MVFFRIYSQKFVISSVVELSLYSRNNHGVRKSANSFLFHTNSKLHLVLRENQFHLIIQNEKTEIVYRVFYQCSRCQHSYFAGNSMGKSAICPKCSASNLPLRMNICVSLFVVIRLGKSKMNNGFAIQNSFVKLLFILFS